MALTCDLPTLNAAVPGSLEQMSDIEKEALLILYLYRQQHPSTVGQTIPADTLLSQAACLDCGVSDRQLAAFEVWIQRQAAIDAGAAESTFDAASAKAKVQCLTCLPMHRLKAIETMLRCQVA